ncbi:MAG: PLP-dependent aspartate aminotransferase family protein, partial [Planctomycetota bacterium]
MATAIDSLPRSVFNVNSGTSPQRSVPPSARPSLSTIAVHGGEARQKPGDAITDAIFCSATYTFPDTQSVIQFIENDEAREEYGRYGNPNARVVERKLAAIEGGERAVVFSSGMSAIVGLLMSKLGAGDEVIFFDECYHRTREFCKKHLSRYGVVSHEVPTGDFEAMRAAITDRTRLLISESPTNPHLSVIDLEAFAELGRETGVETLIDATLATPCNLRPLEFGVDYVVHSATKYLAGHNDLLAGCVIGNTESLESIEYLRGITGGLPAPHTAYLLERGLKTLDLRMQRHNQNGLAVAEFLEQHPRVRKVYYPGLASHRDHAIARRTMHGFGGLIT